MHPYSPELFGKHFMIGAECDRQEIGSLQWMEVAALLFSGALQPSSPPFLFLPPLFFRTLLFNVLHVYSNRRSTKGGSFHLTQLGFFFSSSCFASLVSSLCVLYIFLCCSPRAKPQGRGHRGTLTRQDISFFSCREKRRRGTREE